MIGDRYRLEGTYERLRRALLEAPDDGRLAKPLSYWVLPTDRRLPLAFLDRPLRDLLTLPLSELMETQGVGQKKILGFFDLLQRARRAESPHGPFGLIDEKPAGRGSDRLKSLERHFDPASVSEAVWAEWRQAIHRAELGDLRLGRIAPSLKPLPTVIWRKTLGDYTDLSLQQIRSLKTHGEKRVEAILGVFAATFEAISTATLHENLQIDLAPRFVPGVCRWAIDLDGAANAPSLEEIEEQLLAPLVRQILIDVDDQVATLVKERLQSGAKAPTIKQQADRMRVTRARVYQLLDHCASVMDVRWPEGRWLLAPMVARPGWLDLESQGLLHGIQALFFPLKSPLSRKREGKSSLLFGYGG